MRKVILSFMTGGMLIIFLLGVTAAATPQGSGGPSPVINTGSVERSIAIDVDCGEIVSLLKEQEKKLSRELRQIKREIALLKQGSQSPGLQEIFGGIGYILGLFGIAAYMISRKSVNR